LGSLKAKSKAKSPATEYYLQFFFLNNTLKSIKIFFSKDLISKSNLLLYNNINSLKRKTISK